MQRKKKKLLQKLTCGNTCNNCGSQIEENAKFCPECGAKVEVVDVKKEFCTNCGTERTAGTKFCVNCGNQF